MPKTNPRINMTLENRSTMGSAVGLNVTVSLSLKVRDLIKETLEAEEDRALAKVAEFCEQTLDRRKAMTHSQVWAHLKRPRR